MLKICFSYKPPGCITFHTHCTGELSPRRLILNSENKRNDAFPEHESTWKPGGMSAQHEQAMLSWENDLPYKCALLSFFLIKFIESLSYWSFCIFSGQDWWWLSHYYFSFGTYWFPARTLQVNLKKGKSYYKHLIYIFSKRCFGDPHLAVRATEPQICGHSHCEAVSFLSISSFKAV